MGKRDCLAVDRTHNSRSTEGLPCTALQRPGNGQQEGHHSAAASLGERQHEGHHVERTVAGPLDFMKVAGGSWPSSSYAWCTAGSSG
jgi:hypothetical protein